MLDTEGAVDFLTAVCPRGRVLELGVGTGRVALPLSAKNVEVHGVDVSDSMLAQLKRKDTENSVTTYLADMVDLSALPEFDLVYCIFNSLFAVTSEAGQQKVFESVSSRLVAGGLFVVEASPPTAEVLSGDGSPSVTGMDGLGLTVERMVIDEVMQTIDMTTCHIGPDHWDEFPTRMRYMYPAELRLRASLVGLRTCGVHESWREPFVAERGKQPSLFVFEKS